MATEPFGVYLRRLRERTPSAVQLANKYSRWFVERPLSQNELGHRAGLTAGAVNRLESGCNTRPQTETVLALADALNLDDVGTDRLLVSAGYCPRALAALDGAVLEAVLRALSEGGSAAVLAQAV